MPLYPLCYSILGAVKSSKIQTDYPHCSDRNANNRAEVSHEPTLQRERLMREFKSIWQA